MLVDNRDRLTNELLGHIVTAVSIHDRRVTVQLEATKLVRLICTNAVMVNSMLDCVTLLRLASWDRCIVAARAITMSRRTVLCYLALTNGAYLAILTEDIGLAYSPEGCPATPIRPEHPPS
jgi:hypothetical protein